MALTPEKMKEAVKAAIQRDMNPRFMPTNSRERTQFLKELRPKMVAENEVQAEVDQAEAELEEEIVTNGAKVAVDEFKSASDKKASELRARLEKQESALLEEAAARDWNLKMQRINKQRGFR